MTLDHLAHKGLFNNYELYVVSIFFSRIVGPIMIYFLVDGYFYTKDIKKYLKRLLIFGIISLLVLEIFPNEYISIFMVPTSEVNNIASYIIRIYSISFYFIPFNIFATYFFPSVLKPHFSTAISFLRGLILPALFVYILPLIFSKNSIWFVMPIVECLIGIFALTFLEININKKNNIIAYRLQIATIIWRSAHIFCQFSRVFC